MSGASAGGAQLAAVFGDSTEQESSDDNRAKPTKPFSVRLTDEERAYLEELAGKRPLGAYIRQKLLGEKADKRKRNLRKPTLNDKQYAELLAALGQGRWSSNLNQLAKHANIGTLDVSKDVEQELHDACGAVLAMRDALLMALNLKTGAGR